MTSHAAVVGRQMGKPSIVGAGALEIDEHGEAVHASSGQTVKEGDYISFDGLTGEVKIARVASKPSEILQVVDGTLDAEEVGHLSALRQAAVVGRQVPPAGRPRQRRSAGSGRARLRVRRARHRPVPHRAHVLRRGPHSDRPADDPRRQRSRPPQGARRAAAAAARRLLRRLQGDARLAGHDPHDRSAAARVPAEARRADGRDRAGSRRPARQGKELDEKRHAAARASSSSTSSTRCSATAASASASPIRKSPRCRRARSSKPPAS